MAVRCRVTRHPASTSTSAGRAGSVFPRTHTPPIPAAQLAALPVVRPGPRPLRIPRSFCLSSCVVVREEFFMNPGPDPPPSIHAQVRALLTRGAGREWLLLPAPDARWRLPGGLIREGETPTDAACRVLHDEAGLTTAQDPALGAHIWGAASFGGGPVTITYVFAATAPDTVVPPGEWVDRRGAVSLLDPGDMVCLADLADEVRVPAVHYQEHLP
ncbi:NUDIX domain-containing protein [Saccharopolyspora sp. NPDC002578]